MCKEDNKKNNNQAKEADKKEYELVLKELESIKGKYKDLIWQTITLIFAIYTFGFVKDDKYNTIRDAIMLVGPLLISFITCIIFLWQNKQEKETLSKKEKLEKKIYNKVLYYNKKAEYIQFILLIMVFLLASSISFAIFKEMELCCWVGISTEIFIVMFFILILVMFIKLLNNISV